MQKKLSLALVAIVILFFGLIFGQTYKNFLKTIFWPSNPSQHEIESRLIEGFKEAADEISQNLPMMIDDETRLDKTTVGPGARAVYHLTFLSYTSKDIDVNWLQTNLYPQLIHKVCGCEDMKRSLQYGGIYVYAYSGNDGVEIIRYEIDQKDCGF